MDEKKPIERKKQPFPRIYANAPEDYELYETDEDQIKAVMVDTGYTFAGY